MCQVIDEFVLVPRGEAAERINGTMTLSETAAFIYEHLEEAIKVRDKKANTVNEQDNPLGYEKESKLLVGFAIPCIISMLVTALYNIVDQIFMARVWECWEMQQRILRFRFLLPVRQSHCCLESAVRPIFH